MPKAVAFDTSSVIGFLDDKDIWRAHALELEDVLFQGEFQEIIFDCVLAEAISTLSRRFHEKRRSGDLADLFIRLEERFPKTQITWLYQDLSQLYDQVVGLVRETNGEPNFNDALIAVSCRERNIKFLASFDPDFDRIEWLTRISRLPDLNPPAN